MTFNARERIVLVAMVIVLLALAIAGYLRQARWEKECTLIVQHTTMQVSINRATRNDLESLPGIGPALAGRIIDYRTLHGSFRSLEGLKAVKGIGEQKYRSMLPYIKL